MPRTKLHPRVAIYARVSTDEGKQTPENQLRQLRTYAKTRGFTIAGEYIDYATGRSEERTNYKRLLDAVRKRQVDIVLVWRYDHFARSTKALINALTEFKSLGVDFISYSENIDTTTPQGEMVFTIMASLAQFESALIGERTKAGMQRAKAQGKHIARPPISPALKREIAKLVREKVSINQIAKRLQIGYATAHKYVKGAKA
jgi:DNA invertase Pin-like site-specific DNA recombinase